MDRDEIKRQSFPAARRGYDPGAVEAHLRRVADAFEAAARQRPGSVAAGASDHVRAIVEAAETSAERMREDAGRAASHHVERVEDAAKAMLDKLDRLHGELDRLLGGLRPTAETLAGSREGLGRDVGTFGAAVEPAPASAPSGPPANGDRSDDEAGARLVALNMALEGTPREETARFLTEHYAPADLERLLDDVYASAGR